MASLLDASTFLDPTDAVDFIANVLEASTEYSIIGKDLDGRILLWNEGARRIYGYEAAEVVGKLNSDVLHDPADVDAGPTGKAPSPAGAGTAACSPPGSCSPRVATARASQ